MAGCPAAPRSPPTTMRAPPAAASSQQSGVAGAGFTITGQAGLRSNLLAPGSGQISVVSVEAIVEGGVGDVEILIAHILAPVIMGDSQIIARVLRGRVA